MNNILFGVYDDLDRLVSVHRTESGAEENAKKLDNSMKTHRVDYVVVHK